ncbi:MAG: hypothetical protein DRP84_12445 [Spirochaetes bacterium]|nr:MAG: hypothetical protein DRP84_12445 [Spirochaetota bacterium]
MIYFFVYEDISKEMAGHRGKEKRKYVRLKTVFPVLFQIVSRDKKQILSRKYQGFTKDISASGMCLRFRSLDRELPEVLKNNKDCKILLVIETPFFIKPIHATGSMVWMKKVERKGLDIYLLGIEYEEILLEYQQKIIKKVKLMRDIPKITAGAISILLIIISAMVIHDFRLKKKNSELINQLSLKLHKQLSLRDDLDESYRARLGLTAELDEANRKISLLNEKIKKLRDAQSNDMEALKKQREELMLTKKELQRSIADINNRNLLLEKQLKEIKESKRILESRVFEIMYQYIKLSQNKNTGLIPSFKGDYMLKDCAFTYDEALAILLFTINKDYENAEKILRFYLKEAQRNKNVFYNGYFASDGSVSEYVVHTGPNIFIGLAAIQFTESTGKGKYLSLAEDIADWMIELQSETKDGAIKGGENVNWISTEHNLDAYSLYKQLYRVTKKDKYREAADKVLHWITESAYNPGIHSFNRGENDTYVATDANVLSILSLGPDKMYENEIDPEDILDFIEKRCKVQVEYRRPDNTVVLVEGFDFTDPEIARRKPAISCEWTAQAVIAYRIIADYFKDKNPDKSKDYRRKAEYYMAQLENIALVKGGIIKEKGIGLPLIVMALPYASKEDVNTGHGWRTPQGQETTSLASTIYTIFANKGYNCFQLRFIGRHRSTTLD